MPAQTAKAADQHLYCIAKDSTKLVDTGKSASDIDIYKYYNQSDTAKTLAKTSSGSLINLDPSNCEENIYATTDSYSPTHQEPLFLDSGPISIRAYAARGYAEITNGSGQILGIDNDGKAWFISPHTGDTSVNAERTRTLSDAYRFTKILPFYGGGTTVGGALLLGSPHDTSKTGYVAQMPTSGAPTGLSTVGLAALGLCLLGVTVLARRRG